MPRRDSLRSPRSRCALETLERRELLSLTPAFAAQFRNDGDFTVASIASDADGNAYVTGTFAGTADFDIGPGGGTRNLDAANGPAFVAKYDVGGGLLWVRQFGQGGGATPASVVADPFGAVIVAGSYAGSADLSVDPANEFRQAAAGNRDVFVIKLHPTGDERWVRVATTPADENVVGAVVDQAGTVFLAANLAESGQQGRGYVARFNGKGKGKVFGTFGDGTTALDFTALATNARGDVLLAGNVAGAGVDLDVNFPGVQDLAAPATFLLKLSGAGQYTWAAPLDPAAVTVSGLASDLQGGVYVVGSYSGTADFNPSARKLYTLTAGGDTDAFLAKYNHTGKLSYARSIGGVAADDAQQVALDPDTNDVLVTGTFADKAYFNPGVTRFRFYPVGGVDAFLARFSSGGAFRDASQFGGLGDDAAPLVAAGGDGTVYASGPLAGPDDIDLDPGPDTLNVSNSNDDDTDAYLVQLFEL